MSLPKRTDLANDNGTPENHLAAATAALFASLKELDASIEVLARRVGIEVKVDGGPTQP